MALAVGIGKAHPTGERPALMPGTRPTISRSARHVPCLWVWPVPDVRPSRAPVAA